MNNQLFFILTIIINGILFLRCSDDKKVANTETSFNEEVIVYNDILNEIVDTVSYYKELKQHGGNVAVFFLFDTLTAIDNRTGDYNSEIPYEKALFKKRKFSTDQLNAIKGYKFVRATAYPKDTIINETLNVFLQDELKLEKGEWFANKWLTLSRVCFNSDFTKGYLFYQVWCGNLCSWGKGLDIEKVNGKWRVSKRYGSPIS